MQPRHLKMRFWTLPLIRGLYEWLSADGSYFIEIDRLLRPGGYFVLSGPPVNFPGKEREYETLQVFIAEKMCYSTVSSADKTAVWQKPMNVSCQHSREEQIQAK